MRRLLSLALLAVAATLPACTFARAEINDPSLPARARENLQLGVTTEQQLVDAIGSPPGQIILLPEQQRLLVYSYGLSKTKGFTAILFNVAKTNVAIDTALFLVDAEGTVAEAWVGDNSEDVPWEWWAFGD